MSAVAYYLQQLNLRNFKGRGNILNFSCPYCGDSHNNERKARGYVFLYKGEYVYKCHNCGVSKNFSNFLKDQSLLTYEEYLKDTLEYKYKSQQKEEPKLQASINIDPMYKMKPVSSLMDTHISKIYLRERKIPEKFYDIIYFSPNYKKRLHDIDNSLFSNYPDIDPRIVFPAYSKGNLIFMQGRTLTNDSLRYITYKVYNEVPKVYGLDRIDTNKQIFVTEGILDSFFVDNCLAVLGSDLSMDLLKPLDPILIYDNEPRNEHIVRKMANAIDKGFRLVIHDKNMPYKDLNDMHLNGIDIENYLYDKIYTGLVAKLKLTDWRKI